jgi:hypothetical protein
LRIAAWNIPRGAGDGAGAGGSMEVPVMRAPALSTGETTGKSRAQRDRPPVSR